MASIYTDQVFSLFIGYFGRPPAPAGLTYYSDVMDASDGNWAIIADDFWKSDESESLYLPSLSTRDKIDMVFNFIFSRDAAPAGLDYWEGLINAGEVSLPEIAYTIAYNASAEDTAIIDAKRETAQLWTSSLDTDEELDAFASPAGLAFARGFLGLVDSSTPATQAEVDQGIAQMVAGEGLTVALDEVGSSYLAIDGLAETFVMTFDSSSGVSQSDDAVVAIKNFNPDEDMLRFDDQSSPPISATAFLNVETGGPLIYADQFDNETVIAFEDPSPLDSKPGAEITLEGILDATLGGSTPFFEVA